MSRVPMGSDEAGIDGNNMELRKKLFQVPQGISADLIATLEGFSRAEVDAFALESQRRAEVAQKEMAFYRKMQNTYGLPLDEYAVRAGKIAAVTAADVARVAKALLVPDRMRIVMVGDAAAIREPLKALGL